jgi:hypothetical protein
LNSVADKNILTKHFEWSFENIHYYVGHHYQQIKYSEILLDHKNNYIVRSLYIGNNKKCKLIVKRSYQQSEGYILNFISKFTKVDNVDITIKTGKNVVFSKCMDMKQIKITYE